MKKILTILLTITAMITITYAYAAYSGEEIKGTKTYCYYTDGSIVVIRAGSSCPMSN